MSKEMTAVEYLKTARRICESYRCGDCPLAIKDGDNIFYCKNPMSSREVKNPEEAVAIVQKWAEEHPIKTRQSEFLKIFPNTSKYYNGFLNICPVLVGEKSDYDRKMEINCIECRKKFWLTEVE